MLAVFLATAAAALLASGKDGFGVACSLYVLAIARHSDIRDRGNRLGAWLLAITIAALSVYLAVCGFGFTRVSAFRDFFAAHPWSAIPVAVFWIWGAWNRLLAKADSEVLAHSSL